MFYKKIPVIKRWVPSFRRRLLIFLNKKIFWTKIDNIFYLIDINQKHEREFYFEKKYEKDNFNFILNNSFFNDKFTFIDIGSNIGIYALFFAKNLKNCEKIIAIEPFAKVYKRLKNNISKNLFNDIIKPLNIGLSNTNGRKRIRSLSTKKTVQYATFEINSDGSEEIEVKEFDKLYSFENKNIFIKCDTEGHEFEIINGMKENLINNNCLIQIEIFNKNLSKMNKLFLQLGFTYIGNTKERDSYFYIRNN